MKPNTQPALPTAIYSIAEFKLMRVRETTVQQRLCDSPERAYKYWESAVPKADWFDPLKECMVCLWLNTRHDCIGHHLVGVGTMDGVQISPLEVFRNPLIGGAKAIILTHNHPSGNPTPSEGDIRTTLNLARAGQLLHIGVVDHLVIGTTSPDRLRPYLSLKELGYFQL